MTKRMEAQRELNKARAIIEVGENRALAVDGPVGHCRVQLSNAEFDQMWKHVERARQLLTTPSQRKKQKNYFNPGIYPVKTP